MSPKIAFVLLILGCALLGLVSAKKYPHRNYGKFARVAEVPSGGQCVCPCDGGVNGSSGTDGIPSGPIDSVSPNPISVYEKA